MRQNKDIVVGPGDDCAVIDIGDSEDYFLFAVDQLISDVHYDPAGTLPDEAGAKLIKRNISDIAAMGGRPLHAIITLALGNQKPTWIKRFYQGLSNEANKWKISICGGDIAQLKSKDNSFVSTLSITGKAKKNKICLRKNACAGEILFATGTFGNSYKTGHHLNFIPRVKEALFLSNKFTSAMMDVSDGLLLDIQRLAEDSNVTVQLFLDKIPSRTPSLHMINILSDGEDYELIFTVKPSLREQLIKEWPFKDVKLTKIGKTLPYKNAFVIDNHGTNMSENFSIAGYDHFSPR